jgi:MarR family 2-MHQ and catechol resistance regulon transcriptional repressor
MPTHFKGDQYTVLALDTFIKLTRATGTLETRLQHRGTIHPLSQSQFAVLESLFHIGSLSQGQVSAKVLKSTGNITLVIDNLEKRGLVKRERENNDRRKVMIHLTDAGRDLVKLIMPVHAAAILEELSVLTPEEQASLGELCKKLGRRGE